MATLIDRCEFRVGDVVDGKYTVENVLGEGSFGKVYKVVDNRASIYALKLLRLWDVHPDIRESLVGRFKMEYETGCIKCDNLVQAFDYGMVGGNPYIVMEFCSGGDLSPLLGHVESRSVKICHDILFGLKALHKYGKVHRDLKPENVLFKTSGVAALTDFGIAGDRNHRMTERNILGRPKQVFGTYAYMPPEQVNRMRGQATVLPTTDIFSFGVLAFQLLTGTFPFGNLDGLSDLPGYQKRAKNGDWNKSLLTKIQDGHLWADVISGCLVPNFRNRIQTVGEVIDKLNRISADDISVRINPQYVSKYSEPEPLKGSLLRILQGEGHGQVFSLESLLGDNSIITIGRDINNRICLEEIYTSYVSRKHCCLETDEKRSYWIIRDGQWNGENCTWIDSSNGTFVNSIPVNKNGYYLTHGDIIAIGGFKLRFEQNK